MYVLSGNSHSQAHTDGLVSVGEVLPPAKRNKEQRNGQQLDLHTVAQRGPDQKDAALRHKGQDGEPEDQAVRRPPAHPRSRQQV